MNRKQDRKQTGNVCCQASLLQKEESNPAPSCTDKGQQEVKSPSKGMHIEVASAKCTENSQNSSKTLISGIFHYSSYNFEFIIRIIMIHFITEARTVN